MILKKDGILTNLCMSPDELEALHAAVVVGFDGAPDDIVVILQDFFDTAGPRLIELNHKKTSVNEILINGHECFCACALCDSVWSIYLARYDWKE